MLSILRRTITLAMLVVMLASLFTPFRPVFALPTGFQDTTIISGLTLPTAVRFAPNGKVFVAEKSGLIKVFDSITDSTPTVFADLRPEVQNFDDRGLNSIAVHPNFPTQPYVYAFYSMDAPIGQNPPVYNDACPSEDNCTTGSRLTRLTASGDTMANKTVMLEGWCQQSSHHSAGDIAFGPDGALYVSHGDGGTANYADYGQIGNTCGDPVNEGGALHAQDLRTSGDPVTHAGSLLRVDPITGAAMPNNPLIGGATDDDSIIAYGFRNPFRMTIDSQTSRIFVGNVGWNDWEEVEYVPSPTDAVVENFGWPCYEGVNRQPAYDAANLPICENLYAANTMQRSYYEYATPGGGAISGVALYRGGNFPAAYNGALFFTDYTQSWIKVMMPGANGLPNPNNIVDFVGGGLALAVDLQVGPNGALFYVDIFNGQVHMIRYNTTNQPPVADARADVASGPLPLTVNFNGSNSTDPDPGDTLHYAWDLDADGQFDDSTAINPQFTYSTAGNYTVGLRVTDSQLATNTDTLTISAGNSAPQVTIDSPTTTTTFAAGETISFSGTAVDPDSGPLPASSYKWNFTLNHCAVGDPQNCHQHPMQEIVGVTSGTITAPDHEYPAHVTVTLTATEPNLPNLSSSTSLNFYPRTTTVTFDTVPSGLQVSIYSQTATTPFTREVMQNATTTVSAITPQASGGNTYNFASWSDGGAQTHLINAGTNPRTLTATFNQVATPVTSVWNSWDVVTQGGTPQAKVTAATGIQADLELYESTNNFGIAKGSLLPVFIAGQHPDYSENHSENGWSLNSGGYPYIGKSTIGRGSDTGETNAVAPLGVMDLQVQVPDNNHSIVSAFKIPQNGTYVISNLGVRKTYNAFDGVRYRVFNAQGTELTMIATVNNQQWARSATTYTLPNLTAGQYIYFAADRNNETWYDSAEISWTITADLAPPAPAPVCTLAVNPGSIQTGNSAALSWTSQNTTTLLINNGVGSVSPVAGGFTPVSPTTTTTYTGTAAGPGGTSNCNTTLTVTAVPDTTAPVVNISSPSHDQVLFGNVAITATATDNIGVAVMEVLLDGAVIHSCAAFNPCNYSWNSNSVANGTHSIAVRARDAANNESIHSHDHTVNNVPAPSCVLSVNPASISQGGSATLAWTSNNASTLSINQGIGNVSPVAGGSLSVNPGVTTTYTATATNSNGIAAGCNITLTVIPPDTTVPTVALSAPANGATVAGPNVTVSATASDNIGVAGVQFQLNGADLGSEDTSSPYSVTWNTTQVADGQYTLTAVARDAAGNNAISSARTVTVTNAAAASQVWNSWDVTTQPGSPQGRVASNAGVSADLEFYESTNSLGVAKSGLLSTYIAGPHPDAAENNVQNVWSGDSGGYPYAGKSMIGRGSDSGEAGALAPLGVSDLQLHAPNNDHTLVAAFKIPQDGSYTISNLGVRKVHSNFDGVRYRVFNAQATEITNIPTVTNRTWATSGNTYTLPNLIAGQYIYFAIDRINEVWYDSAEISWTVTLASSSPDTTAPSVALSAPANGANVTGTNVTVSATASDNIGIVGVQFKLDGNNLGAEDLTSPYSVSWNTTTATPGQHTLTAVARDAAGNTTTSAVRTVSVANAVTGFPTLYTLLTGTFGSGTLASLTADDNNFMVINSTTNSGSRLTSTEFEFSNVLTSLSRLDYSIRLRSSGSNTTTTIQAFNVTTGTWTQIHSSTTSTAESTKSAAIATGAANYVNAQGKSRIRVLSSRSSNHSLSHELVQLTATP